MKEVINLGTWTEQRLTGLLKEASMMEAPGERIAFLSKHFLNTPYKESTLTGDINSPEVVVINLEEVDCFTFIDYMEALRRSRSFTEFTENLRNVRYRSAELTFHNRNHFFTDWAVSNSDYIVDASSDTGAEKITNVRKILNDKGDGTFFIPGVSCREREFIYVPAIYINETVTGHLKSGDYIGIYSEKEGLDVSHVGIIIREQDAVKLRHASSQKNCRKVIDEDFLEYMKDKPGIIVLRPRDER